MNNDVFKDDFLNECGRILNELYYNPLPQGDPKFKRILINAAHRHIDYLVGLNLIKKMNYVDGKFAIQMEVKGYEVFEQYDGWRDYYNKVIRKRIRVENAKSKSLLFWWLPILISIISLVVSIIALLYHAN